MEKFKPPAAGEWTFKNAAIAGDFDRHVREQLPWYDIATGIVAHIGRHYVTEGGRVIDIGASTGNVARALAQTLEKRGAHLLALDNAADMLNRYTGPGEPIVADARSFDYAEAAPDLIVAFLVLMFLPVPDRLPLIERLKASVKPGGAIIVFDKMAARGGHVGSVIYRMTLAAKYEAGATPEEIIAKELSLAGVQRPMSENELPGFEPIFRFGDFAGWLFERPAVNG